LRGFNNSDTEIAIVVSAGVVTDLSPAVGQGTTATGINNAGMICGWSWNSPDSFIYNLSTHSIAQSIPPLPGQKSSVAGAINDTNEVVGRSGNAGFYFNSGNLKALGTVAFVTDINHAGMACGSVGQPYPANFAAAICETRQASPVFTPIALPPGAIGSHGEGINSQGDVVGTFWTATTYNGQQSAYIYHNGVSTDLNTLISAPGWHLESAEDINDAGQIVGNGSYNGGQTAFLLTPQRSIPKGVVSLPELVGILLGGVAVDGGGWIIIGGIPHPVDPWGAWGQIQVEKRDTLVALAMDEIAMYLVDPSSREAVRKTLIEVAGSRLEALDLQRGRSGPPAAARGRTGAASSIPVKEGKRAFSLMKYGRQTGAVSSAR
jgi:probable HAF family extracellular repeat protein